MNDDEPIQKIFRPFREAKAPPGFAEQVMARLTTPSLSWSKILGFGSARGRWAWAGGMALAASLAVMISHPKTPVPLEKADLSFYLADSIQLEEESDLGTQIETYFL